MAVRGRSQPSTAYGRPRRSTAAQPTTVAHSRTRPPWEVHHGGAERPVRSDGFRPLIPTHSQVAGLSRGCWTLLCHTRFLLISH